MRTSTPGRIAPGLGALCAVLLLFAGVARAQAPAALHAGKTAAQAAQSGVVLGNVSRAVGPGAGLWIPDQTPRVWTPASAPVVIPPPSVLPFVGPQSVGAQMRLTNCLGRSCVLLPFHESVTSASMLIGDPLGHIARLIQDIYPSATDAQIAYTGVLQMIADFDGTRRVGARTTALSELRPGDPLFNQRDIFLITYGDMIEPAAGKTALGTLTDVVESRLPGVNTVHILPFYPSTSDGGFAVADYGEVAPELGTWEDVARLRESRKLMFDAVDNHTSASHPWFREFLAGNPEFADFYVEVSDPTLPALENIFRPRTLPLTHEFDGRHIWTTFSEDQVDLNARNPRVLLALLQKDLDYVERGATALRKDAITFLFKVPEARFAGADPPAGRDTIHLPETHAAVQLQRAILDLVAPDVAIVTETNVPHAENVSYFGGPSQREADMVYNFPLPPLVAHTFVSGNTEALVKWLGTLDELPSRAVLFNFLASHDGIGVGGARGFISEDDIDRLADTARAKGGLIGEGLIDGETRPYELNITWPSLLTDVDATLAENAGRLLASYSIQLSLKGVPAIYFPTFMSEPNWTEGAESLTRRDINRRRFDLEEVQETFQLRQGFEPEHTRAHGWTTGAIAGLTERLGREPTLGQVVYHQLEAMVEMRGAHLPFSPTAAQLIVDADPGVVSILRHTGDGRRGIFSLTNVTGERRTVTYDVGEIRSRLAAQGYDNPLRDNIEMVDILTARRARVQDDRLTVEVGPYETLWLNAPILLK